MAKSAQKPAKQLGIGSFFSKGKACESSSTPALKTPAKNDSSQKENVAPESANKLGVTSTVTPSKHGCKPDTSLNGSNKKPKIDHSGSKSPPTQPREPPTHTASSENHEPLGQKLAPRSCSCCRSSKRKCDKLLPKCSACEQRAKECSYEPTPRKPKDTAQQTVAKAKENQNDLSASSGKGDGKTCGSAIQAPAVEAAPLDEAEIAKTKALFSRVLTDAVDREKERPDHHVSLEREAAAIFAELNSSMDNAQVLNTLSSLLSSLVQGSSQPLSALSERALGDLRRASSQHGKAELLEGLTASAMADKLLLLAERKPYGIRKTAVDALEDTSAECLWGWEVTLVEGIFRKDSQNAIKRAIRQRKRSGGYLRALNILLNVLEKNPGDKAKISQQKMKVARFGQEEEVQRMKLEAQRRKEEQKLADEKQKKEQKEKEQQAKAEQKQREQQAKAEQKEKERREKEQEIQRKEEAKKKMSVMNFFTPKVQTKSQPRTEAAATNQTTPGATDTPGSPGSAAAAAATPAAMAARAAFDQEAFDFARRRDTPLEELLAFPPRPKPVAATGSSGTDTDRRPLYRTLTVSVSKQDNPFAAPYVELEERRFRNRMKTLAFHEDVRPPYVGTWTRASAAVTGRRPFGQDPELDYEYDSEAEWEEGQGGEGGGDDGESLGGSDVEGEGDEPGDGLDYGDGWLREEDDLGSDREGEEEVGLAHIALGGGGGDGGRAAAGGAARPLLLGPRWVLGGAGRGPCPPPPAGLEGYFAIPLLGPGDGAPAPVPVPQVEVGHGAGPGASPGHKRPCPDKPSGGSAAKKRTAELDDEMLRFLVKILKGQAIKKDDAVAALCAEYPAVSKKLAGVTIAEHFVKEAAAGSGALGCGQVYFVDVALLRRLGLPEGDPFACLGALDEPLERALAEGLAGPMRTWALDRVAHRFRREHPLVTRRLCRKAVNDLASRRAKEVPAAAAAADAKEEEAGAAAVAVTPTVYVWDLKPEVVERFGLQAAVAAAASPPKPTAPAPTAIAAEAEAAAADVPAEAPPAWQRSVGAFFSASAKAPAVPKSPATPGRCQDGGYKEVKGTKTAPVWSPAAMPELSLEEVAVPPAKVQETRVSFEDKLPGGDLPKAESVGEMSSAIGQYTEQMVQSQ